MTLRPSLLNADAALGQSERLVELSFPLLERSTAVNRSTGVQEEVDYRISESAVRWFLCGPPGGVPCSLTHACARPVVG